MKPVVNKEEALYLHKIIKFNHHQIIFIFTSRRVHVLFRDLYWIDLCSH